MNIKHSLVVPCYNEEGNVEKFLEEAQKAMSGYTESYEIVFINDGSSDKTGAKLKELWNKNKDVKIKVITFSRNFGKEAAMYAGLSNAAGEYVTIIDADLQQSPEYAVKMGRILDENPECDMVAAYQHTRIEGRFITKCKDFFYKKISKMTEVDMSTKASDFRTMRRNVVETIISLSEYHRFSKGIFAWIGYNSVTIPYEVNERLSGETKWNFSKLFKYALEGFVAYSDAPLRLPFYSGFIMGMIAVLQTLAFVLVDVLTEFNISLGYIASAVLFVGSVICILLGIFGYYLGKIHTQVKSRPIYIAKEILTYEND